MKKIYIKDGERCAKGVTGYCAIARSFIKELFRGGYEIYVTNTQKYPVRDQIFNTILKEAQALGEEHFSNDPDTVYLWISPPYSFKGVDKTKKNVGYTMHELDFLPEEKKFWVEKCNQMNMIITPTEWNKQMWVKEGVTVPIVVCPCGVDTKMFNDGKDNSKFRVLAVHDGLGNASSREFWQETIECFTTSLPKGECQLTIKTWNTNRQFNFPDNIKVDTERTLNEDMIEYYKNHHVFIKNTYNEGWSQPTCEAIACGMTVLSRPFPAGDETFLRYHPNVKIFKTNDELKKLLDVEFTKWVKIENWKLKWDYSHSTRKLIKILEGI